MHNFQLIDIRINDTPPRGIKTESFDAADLLLSNGFDPTDRGDTSPLRDSREITVTLFGRTDSGKSIGVHVYGFKPVLYFAEADISDVKLAGLLSAANIKQYTLKRTRMCNGYGFEPDEHGNRKQFSYFEVRFSSLRSFSAIAKYQPPETASGTVKDACARLKELMHEEFIDHTSRFWTDANIHPGWIQVNGKEIYVREDNGKEVHKRSTTCTVEVECTMKDLCNHECYDLAPFRVAYFDIETYGLDASTAPMCTIGFSVKTLGQDGIEEHCLQVGDTSPSEGQYMISVSDETALVRAFRDFIITNDIDCLVSYNGTNFDESFIMKRIDCLSAKGGGRYVETSLHCSRFIYHKCNPKILSLKSAAMGDNELTILDTPGIAHFDWYIKFKLEDKEPSYKLEYFGQKYCDAGKDPMHYSEIPILAEGTPDDRRRLAKYCIQDCTLLAHLADKRYIFESLFSLNAVCNVPPEWVYFRGQQPRYYSQKLFECRHNIFDNDGRHVTVLLRRPEEGFSGVRTSTFEGAIVIEPISGYYVEEPISVLDFASLYPSCLIDENLSPDTLVQKPEFQSRPTVKKHVIANTFGLVWVPVDKDSIGPENVVLMHSDLIEALAEEREFEKSTLEAWYNSGLTKLHDLHYVRVGSEFLKPESRIYHFETNVRGVVPQIVENLLLSRKKTKKKMVELEHYLDEHAEIDTMEKKRIKGQIANLNAKQLAEKVSANSIYGAQGAFATSRYYCLAVAESTTNEARNMLLECKRFAEENYECEIVYGDTDSIFIRFNGVKDIQENARISKDMEVRINEMYKSRGMRKKAIEFEKSYLPLLLLQKKRYSGLQYEENKFGEMVFKKHDSKGLEVGRRDYCDYARTVFENVLHSLMYDRDVDKVLAVIDRNIRAMIDDEVDKRQFVLSKRLASAYANEQAQPHWVVNQKRRSRQPGSEFKSGERVSYVVINGHPNAKLAEIVEDADYVMEKNIKINHDWYLSHQMTEPITRMLGPIPRVPRDLLARYKGHLTRKRLGMTSLVQFSTTATTQTLASTSNDDRGPPPNKRSRKGPTKGVRPLSSFAN
jgi:DNA polymerase elongation subunit (family B)